MTQVSPPRRTRILPPSPIAAAEKIRRQEQRDAIAAKSRVIFERLRPQLREAYNNWHIAIDHETENYLLDPTLNGIIQKIRDAYGKTNEVKLTIFRLNDTGTCGRLWL
ncbi:MULTISPECIES: hypothetical protein [Calothrix]|uniref:Uncharacterized protein n=2 Tax=Calothrix TaxID=1186 RepID=A0ABR8AM66_9CYAN|nr:MULTISPECIES: hypothetical protein [Calothrix]MBD2200714.1 hypothetical protein [Calothrix parietina FACHB-288]MBD2224692.1 hypothetical protein [Calothrix anomala FACHB-343]